MTTLCLLALLSLNPLCHHCRLRLLRLHRFHLQVLFRMFLALFVDCHWGATNVAESARQVLPAECAQQVLLATNLVKSALQVLSATNGLHTRRLLPPPAKTNTSRNQRAAPTSSTGSGARHRRPSSFVMGNLCFTGRTRAQSRSATSTLVCMRVGTTTGTRPTRM